MATYAELQTELIDLLSGDTQIDNARAQTFIARAEPKLDRDMLDEANGGTVPRQKMARLIGVTASDGTFDLTGIPFHKARSVIVNGLPMRYASPEKVPFTNLGVPQPGFEDNTLQIDDYQTLTPLSDSNTSNWLLEIGFDAYLWGSALQWVAWGQEQELLPLWTEYYRDAVRTIKSTHNAQSRGGNRRQNGRYYKGFYTVIGEVMYFGRGW